MEVNVINTWRYTLYYYLPELVMINTLIPGFHHSRQQNLLSASASSSSSSYDKNVKTASTNLVYKVPPMIRVSPSPPDESISPSPSSPLSPGGSFGQNLNHQGSDDDNTQDCHLHGRQPQPPHGLHVHHARRHPQHRLNFPQESRY